MNKQNIFYTIIFSFITTFVFVFLLAFTYDLTKVKINQNQELYLKKAVLTSLQVTYQDKDDIATQFAAKIKKIDSEEYSIYSLQKSGQINYAIIFSGNGLWGTITGALAVNENLSRIIGVDIISHNETPGLGGRIDEPYFKEQFTNEKIINNKISIKITGDGDENHENGEIDAISGATRTSDFFEIMINNYLLKMKNFLESSNDKQ